MIVEIGFFILLVDNFKTIIMKELRNPFPVY